MIEEIDSSRFHRLYPNLPLPERRMTCVVIDGEPISWKLAYMEIKNKTKLSKKILEKLAEMKLI